MTTVKTSDTIEEALERAEYKGGEILEYEYGHEVIVKDVLVDLNRKLIMYRLRWEASGKTSFVAEDEMNGYEQVGQLETRHRGE
jgi:hypothetical protein